MKFRLPSTIMKKCEWIGQQTYEAKKTGWVHIRDGRRIPVWQSFRCLYCGEYFHQAGAEEHYGKTRIEFNENAKSDIEIEVANVPAPKKRIRLEIIEDMPTNEEIIPTIQTYSETDELIPVPILMKVISMLKEVD